MGAGQVDGGSSQRTWGNLSKPEQVNRSEGYCVKSFPPNYIHTNGWNSLLSVDVWPIGI